MSHSPSKSIQERMESREGGRVRGIVRGILRLRVWSAPVLPPALPIIACLENNVTSNAAYCSWFCCLSSSLKAQTPHKACTHACHAIHPAQHAATRTHTHTQHSINANAMPCHAIPEREIGPHNTNNKKSLQPFSPKQTERRNYVRPAMCLHQSDLGGVTPRCCY